MIIGSHVDFYIALIEFDASGINCRSPATSSLSSFTPNQISLLIFSFANNRKLKHLHYSSQFHSYQSELLVPTKSAIIQLLYPAIITTHKHTSQSIRAYTPHINNQHNRNG